MTDAIRITCQSQEQYDKLAAPASTTGADIIREAVEAAFEERDGWRVKIAQAVRQLAAPAPSSAAIKNPADAESAEGGAVLSTSIPPSSAAGLSDALPDGFVMAPHYRGYAELGMGQYVLNHSRSDQPAEFVISVASDEEKAGRTVGDERENPDGKLLQPDAMAVRIAFANVAGLDAMEQQLRKLRAEHFPAATPAKAGLSEFPPLPKEFGTIDIYGGDGKQRIAEILAATTKQDTK